MPLKSPSHPTEPRFQCHAHHHCGSHYLLDPFPHCRHLVELFPQLTITLNCYVYLQAQSTKILIMLGKTWLAHSKINYKQYLYPVEQDLQLEESNYHEYIERCICNAV